MKDKSICFISPSSYGYFNPKKAPAVGGAQRQLYLLAKEISKKAPVKFIVGDYGQPEVERRDGITLFKSYRPTPNSNFFQMGFDIKELWVAMKKASADVYVTRGTGSGRAVFDYLFAHILGDKWVFNAVNEPSTHEKLAFPLRLVFRRGITTSTVICQTELDAGILQSYYNIDAKVVHNGYTSATSLYNYENREYFLWVGRLTKSQKRPHLYLDLAEELPNERFLLIGPPDGNDVYVNKIINRCDQLDNVEYLGGVNPDEIHKYYKRSIALVSTSSTEGFPNVFLEAWRYGAPVLSLDVDMHEKVGIEFPGYAGGELSELKEYTEKVSSSIELLKEWGEQSRSNFEQHFTIEQVAKEYLNVICGSG